MRAAAILLLISAALHVIGVILAGFAPGTLFLLLPAVIYLALCAGLAREKMWVAWIAFICMLGGLAGVLAELLGASPITEWVLWGILATDAIAASVLFGAIWQGRTQQEA